jgi:RHS repeat-associated protein
MKKTYLAMLLIIVMVFSNIGFAVNLEYDDLGNLIESKDNSYEYNSFNQLSKVFSENELLEEYFYDESGNRVKKVSYGDDFETTYYIDNNFVRIINSSGTFDVVYYYDNGQQVAKKENNELKLFHPDHLGSTTLITDFNGELLEETRYLPFGAVLAGGEEDFLYTGKEKDNSGLYYYEARYYDPFLRKFTQPDSIIPSAYNPQSFNQYSYVMNNPYKYVDPSGNVAIMAAIGIAATVGAAIFGTVNVVSQMVENGDVGAPLDGGDIISEMAGGAAAGATVTAIPGSGVAANVIGGVIAGQVGELVQNVVNPDESWNEGLLQKDNMAMDAVFGVVANGLGKFVQKADYKNLKHFWSKKGLFDDPGLNLDYQYYKNVYGRGLDMTKESYVKKAVKFGESYFKPKNYLNRHEGFKYGDWFDIKSTKKGYGIYESYLKDAKPVQYVPGGKIDLKSGKEW